MNNKTSNHEKDNCYCSGKRDKVVCGFRCHNKTTQPKIAYCTVARALIQESNSAREILIRQLWTSGGYEKEPKLVFRPLYDDEKKLLHRQNSIDDWVLIALPDHLQDFNLTQLYTS